MLGLLCMLLCYPEDGCRRYSQSLTKLTQHLLISMQRRTCTFGCAHNYLLTCWLVPFPTLPVQLRVQLDHTAQQQQSSSEQQQQQQQPLSCCQAHPTLCSCPSHPQAHQQGHV